MPDFYRKEATFHIFSPYEVIIHLFRFQSVAGERRLYFITFGSEKSGKDNHFTAKLQNSARLYIKRNHALTSCTCFSDIRASLYIIRYSFTFCFHPPSPHRFIPYSLIHFTHKHLSYKHLWVKGDAFNVVSPALPTSSYAVTLQVLSDVVHG